MTHLDDPSTRTANLAYIRRAMAAPMLEREEEADLARRWLKHQDEAALHALINSHTRLVIALAVRFKAYGLPLGDLIQEGTLGLLHAAGRFDPEREVRFSTYAAWWIRAALQDFILRNWSIVRTGTTAAQKSLFFNLRRLRARIQTASAETPDACQVLDQIAQELHVPIRDVEDMAQRLSSGDRSLNAPVSADGEEEWQSLLPDEHPNPEEIVIGMKDSQTRSRWLARALGDLSDREQTIIRRRHLGQEPVTLDDLGIQLGISKERVRQIEQRAMIRLKDSLMIQTGGQIQDLFES